MHKIENPLNAWMGIVPVEWEIKRTKYIFSIKKEIAGEEGYTVLSVTQHGIKPKDMDAKGQFAADYSKYQLVNKGDFVMNHMDLLTGWVDISDYDGVTSPDYRVFVLENTNRYYADYYKYIFQLCYKHRIYYELGQGVSGFGRWRLPADMFLNFELPVPKHDEQVKIAKFLKKQIETVDEVIYQTNEYLEQYEIWKKSKIREIVNTGVNASDRPVSIKLKYLLDIRSGDSKDKNNISDVCEVGMFPVYGGGSLIGYSDGYNCAENNLLIGRVGSCGKVTRLTTNTWATDNALIVEPKININYLYYILVDADLKTLSTTNAQPLVTGTKIKNHSVIYFEDQKQQDLIVEKLDTFCRKVDSLVDEKRKLLSELERYKTSLIYEYVTGKRRVV